MKKILVAYLLLASCLFTAYANPAVRLERRGLTFTENKGQVVDVEGNARPDVKFTSEKNGVSVYFRSDAISYVFPQVKQTEEGPVVTGLYRSDVEFLGANPDVQLVAENKATGYTNYMTAAGTFSNVPSFEKLVYKNLYDNIDLVFYPAGQENGQLKYEFVVRPGADASAIQMKHNGASSLRVDGGRLVSENTVGSLVEEAPFTFQTRNGKQVEIASKYAVENGVVTFEIGDYNAKNTLVIDPLTRLWATNIGGSRLERGSDVAFDNAGNTVIAGFTASSDFPATVGLTASQGQNDIIVAKFDANGNRLWSLYYGGSGTDQAYGVAVDGSNNINVGGYTTSAGLSSGTSNSYSGSGDGVIMQLDPNGNVNWSRYYGGASNDRVESLDVWANGDVAVAGRTLSSLPGANGAAPAQLNGFAGRFSGVDGSTTWVNYAGGSGFDEAKAIAVDNNNNVFVAGYSASSDFPATIGSGAATNRDGFVAKYDANGNALWATLIGGSQNDFLLGATTDANGNVFVVGYTNSADFPTQLAFQNTLNGTTDATLTAYDANGGRIMSTYAGGSEREQAFDVARAGNFVYVAGNTNSANFPSVDVANSNLTAGQSANNIFTLRLNLNNLTTSQSSILYGGQGDDVATGIDAMSNGMIALTGYSNSSDYPRTLTTNNAPGLGNDDAIVIKYQDPEVDDACPALTVTTTNNSPFCGMNAGMVTVTAPTGSDWSYAINGGASQTSNMFNGLAAGTYTVTAINNNCSYNSAAITLQMAPAISVSVSNSTIACGASNGVLSANVTGGMMPFSYAWSNGQTSQTAVNLAQGSYTVTVTDMNGCTAFGSASVNTLSNVSLNVTSSNVTCLNSSGSISAIANGGVSPYTYTLSGPVNNQNNNGVFASLPAGTYMLNVSDNNGCTAMQSVVIQNTVAFVTANATGIDGNCLIPTPSVISFSPAGGQAPYTFSIDGGATFSNSLSFVDVAPGSYEAVVRDNNGCESNPETVVISTSGGVQINSIDALVTPDCGTDDGAILITYSGGPAPYNVEIEGNSTITNGTTFSQINLEAGEYTISVTDNQGCETTQNFTLEADPNSFPELVINATNPLCGNEAIGTGSIRVSANSPSHTQFYYGLDGNVFPFSLPSPYTYENLGGGDYQVSVSTSPDGDCMVMQTVTLTNPPQINVNSAVSTPAPCNGSGGTITINAVGGTGSLMYSIDGGVSFQSSNVFTGVFANDAGYNIVVEDINGCRDQDNRSVSVTNVSGLSLNPANVELVRPSCNAPFGEINVEVTNGIAPFSFYLDGTFIARVNSRTFTYPNVQQGMRQIVIKDFLGCEVSAMVNFAPLSLDWSVEEPTCGGTGDEYTRDGIINVSVTGGTGPYDYEISEFEARRDQTGAAGPDTDSEGFEFRGTYNYPSVVTDDYTFPRRYAPGVYIVEVTDLSDISCILRDTITLDHAGIQYNDTTADAYFAACPNDVDVTIIVENDQSVFNADDYSILGFGPSVNAADRVATAIGARGGSREDAGVGTPPAEFFGRGYGTYFAFSRYSVVPGTPRCVHFVNQVTAFNPDPIKIDSVVVEQPRCDKGSATGGVKIYASGGTGRLEYIVGTNDGAGPIWYPSNLIIPEPGIETFASRFLWTEDQFIRNLDDGQTYPASRIRVRSRRTDNFFGCDAVRWSDFGGANVLIQDLNNSFNIATSVTNTTCNNTNGEIEVRLTARGANTLQPPFTYILDGVEISVDNPSSVYTFENLEGKIDPYLITVKDKNGCFQNATVSLDNNSLEISSITKRNVTGCNDGAIDVILVGSSFDGSFLELSINGGNSYSLLEYVGGGTNRGFVSANDFYPFPPGPSVRTPGGNLNTATNSNAFENLLAGVYNVVVRNPSNGCEVSGSTTIRGNGTLPDLSILSMTAQDPRCPGATDGVIQLQVETRNFNAGVDNVRIRLQRRTGASAWTTVSEVNISSNGVQPVIDFPSLQAGEYRFQFNFSGTLNCGGLGNLTLPNVSGVWLELNAITPVAISSVDAFGETACGMNDGRIVINTTGGSGAANLEYSIDGGDSFQPGNEFSGLTPGIYLAGEIIVRDNNGCPANDNRVVWPNNVTITSGNGLAFTGAGVVVTNPLPCSATNTGNIQITASGGSRPYELYVNTSLETVFNLPDPFTYVLSNQMPGVYNIEVRDAQGCRIVTKARIEDGSLIPATVTIAQDPSGCGQNNGVIQFTIDPRNHNNGEYLLIANGNPFGTWQPINTTNVLLYEQTLLPVSAGTYVLKIRDNASICEVETRVTLQDQTFISFDNVLLVQNPRPIGCNDGVALAQVTGSASGVTFQYSDDGGLNWNNSTSNVVYTALPQGDLIFRVVSTAGANKCYNYFEDVVELRCGALPREVVSESEVSRLTVYPNPTRDNVTVKMDATTEGAAVINITDVTGRTVATQSFETVLGTNEVSVDMNGLTSGVYFLQVVSADGLQTVKVVKQ